MAIQQISHPLEMPGLVSLLGEIHIGDVKELPALSRLLLGEPPLRHRVCRGLIGLSLEFTLLVRHCFGFLAPLLRNARSLPLQVGPYTTLFFYLILSCFRCCPSLL